MKGANNANRHLRHDVDYTSYRLFFRQHVYWRTMAHNAWTLVAQNVVTTSLWHCVLLGKWSACTPPPKQKENLSFYMLLFLNVTMTFSQIKVTEFRGETGKLVYDFFFSMISNSVMTEIVLLDVGCLAICPQWSTAWRTVPEISPAQTRQYKIDEWCSVYHVFLK